MSGSQTAEYTSLSIYYDSTTYSGFLIPLFGVPNLVLNGVVNLEKGATGGLSFCHFSMNSATLGQNQSLNDGVRPGAVLIFLRSTQKIQ